MTFPDTRQSKIVLASIIVMTLLCLYPLSTLTFQFSLNRLFPEGDEETLFFRKFQDEFHCRQDAEYIFLGLENDKGIFNREFLNKTRELTEFLKNHPSVARVYSPTAAYSLYFKGDEINVRPLMHIDSPAYYSRDSNYFMRSEEFRNLMISDNGKFLAVAAYNKPNLSDSQKDSLLQGIESLTRKLKFDRHHLVSKIRIERVYVQEIIQNLKKYLILSVLIICGVLYLFFRSVKIVAFQLWIIISSLIWTLSIIALTGESVDIITSLLPPVLVAICMSDIIHISAHYFELMDQNIEKNRALEIAFKETGKATFFTCLIVSAGFLSLSFTDIIPVRNFGFFAAVGILISFLISVPSMYTFFRITNLQPGKSSRTPHISWNSFLKWLFHKVIFYRYITLVVAVLAVVISIWGILQIKQDAGILQEIPKKHPILMDYRFIDQHFSGTRPFEMVLDLKDSTRTFVDHLILTKVNALEHFLKDSCGVGAIISPLSLFKGANKAHHNGLPEHYHLPESTPMLHAYLSEIQQTEFGVEWLKYMSVDTRQLRISGRMPDLTLSQFQEVERKIARHFKHENYGSTFSYHLTGESVLLDRATLSLSGNLLPGIVIDLVLLSLVAMIILRSLKAVFSMLIPNIIPVLLMAGIMGMTGIYLKADTAVIFAIALAIVADDTIHFLSRFTSERRKGKSVYYAIKSTYLSSGKAIILTTIVLLSGFMILLTSSFGGAFYIGFLISTCLLIALITELTLTPLMILFFQDSRKKSNK